MKREEFKFMAAGQYAYLKREATIDKAGLDIYVEGALFGYDMAFKLITKSDNYKLPDTSKSATIVLPDSVQIDLDSL